jgi:hypothetical protein
LYKIKANNMRQLTINIEDSRYWQFLQFISTLDYVKIQDNVASPKIVEDLAKPSKNFFADLQTLPIPVDNVIIDRAEIYDDKH